MLSSTLGKIKMYVGMDFAFAKNGFVVLGEDGTLITQKVIVSGSKKSDEERLDDIMVDVSSEVPKNTKLVCIEGLSFGSKGNSLAQMGALHYLVRLFLYHNKINYKIVTPTQLKKFVTGSGKVQKNLMLLKIYKKWGIEFSDDNIADAYALARFAYEEDHNNEKVKRS
jgi:crossover junction endodeoxyribonuclease RuvC